MHTIYNTPPKISKLFWTASDIREKNAPSQSIDRKTKLIPITLPLRFHSSPYGGNKPTAKRIFAIIPTTKTPVPLPASYNGRSVTIRAACTPAKAAALASPIRTTFHIGHLLLYSNI